MESYYRGCLFTALCNKAFQKEKGVYFFSKKMEKLCIILDSIEFQKMV